MTRLLHRAHVAVSGTFVAGPTKVPTVAGCVLLEPRQWPFSDPFSPMDIRQDVGVGHLLHFFYSAGLHNKALMCPMACQLRSPENLSKALTDLPADYYTETMFALGIVQAADLGKGCPWATVHGS